MRIGIISSDARQHGCDRQGIEKWKAARTDARAIDVRIAR
jgi:hypothetical protein